MSRTNSGTRKNYSSPVIKLPRSNYDPSIITARSGMGMCKKTWPISTK
ncbi:MULTISPECIES: hypothetical protein [Petrotoga]|jgi:hypothetical protein|nr:MULTISPECIES: hypothetical protein [Petrotoga]